jgi:hypothetical protein
MNTFYAQVSNKRIQGEDFEKIVFWTGGADGKTYKIPDELIEEIKPYACAHDPHKLRVELLKDQKAKSERIYFLDEANDQPLPDDGF